MAVKEAESQARNARYVKPRGNEKM